MNICVISGQVEQNGIVRGKKTKALVFTVTTKQRGNGASEEEQELLSHVPCVIFNPPEDIEQLLTLEGKGMHIEFFGRVNASRQEGTEPRSNADVVVFTKSVRATREVCKPAC